MLRGRKVLAVVAALVAAQVFSGCYVLRELDWSKDKVDKGKTTDARIGLQGTNEDVDGRFFMLSLLEGEAFNVQGAKFDTGKKLGGTKKMVADSVLASEAFSDQDCSAFLPIRARGGDDILQAYRTNGAVPESNKLVNAELTLKASNSNQGGGVLGGILTGVWVDDGDGLPESDEDEIVCTGISSTSVTKKGPAPDPVVSFDLGDLGG